MSRARALRYAAPLVAIALLLGLRHATHVESLAKLGANGAGVLAVTRGGPVVFGWVNGDAKLTVAGQVMTNGQRVVLPAGPTPFSFTSANGARPTWSPVGRRGGGEYIPASSLSADGTFDEPGADRADGLYALAILLVIVAALLGLVRARLAAVPRAMWIAIAAVFAGAVIVRWIDLGGFGQAWDEDVNWTAGRNYVTNLLGLDFRPGSWLTNYEHPPIMKYLDGIGAQLADGFGPARALSAVWVALGCALLVPIGARLYSLRVGVLAAVIAALLPPLIAHGQIVGHESPTVLWWSLGILLSLSAHEAATPRAFKLRLAWIGVVLGIAIASRFVNGLLGPLCGLILMIQAPREQRTRTLALGAAILPIVALLTLYAVWPRLWGHPFAAMAESFKKLDNTHAPEPFLGTVTATPGPYYFLVYLVATLPLGVLLGVVLFGVRAARERSRAALLVGLWFLVPLGVALSPVRQDGVRYVMPCLTAFAMMAAAGVDYLARRLPFAIVSGVLVGYLGVTAVRAHPYYLDYFAEQVGGAGTVARHQWFETAWWGEGVAAGVDYVNEHAAPNAKIYRECIQPAHLAWFRADLWTPMVKLAASADWIVWYAPDDVRCAIPKDFTLAFETVFDGVSMVRVYRR